MEMVSENVFFDLVTMIGSPTTVMLLSVLLAIYTMGIARKIPMKDLMESAESAVRGNRYDVTDSWCRWCT